MNKLILVALVAASVAVACAHIVPDGLDHEKSELALKPSDDLETAKLEGTDLFAFRDFCIRTRDTVIGDMMTRGNIFASDVFASLFRSLGETVETGLKANKEASSKLSKQLANPDAPIDESGQTEVDKIVVEGQKAIHEAENQPKSLIAAFTAGIKSFALAGYADGVSKIMELQQQYGADKVSASLIGFCEQLSTYEQMAKNIFEETKSDLVAEDATRYSNVKFSDVSPKCVTANRLSRIEGFCKFVLAVKKPLASVFGFSLPSDISEQ